jgi:hypothetical protein
MAMARKWAVRLATLLMYCGALLFSEKSAMLCSATRQTAVLLFTTTPRSTPEMLARWCALAAAADAAGESAHIGIRVHLPQHSIGISPPPLGLSKNGARIASMLRA